MRFLLFLIVAVAALIAYIRLAPTNVAKWHKLPDVSGPGDVSSDDGFLSTRRITTTPAEVLAAVEEQALATPRTEKLKGSVDDGMMTFQTRSAVMGFPDHTTVAVRGDLLIMHGRLRFGRKDLGVNRARIVEWLQSLDHLTERL